jgi:transposase
MAHANARLGPAGRRRLVGLMCEWGWSERRAAEAVGVSRCTAHRWKRRWLAAGEAERVSGGWAQDRSSRPHHCPRQTAAALEARVLAERERTGWGPRLIAGPTGVAHSTVHAILKRHGRSRAAREPREPFVRYEWPCPGDLVHMDVKRYRRFRRPGYRLSQISARPAASWPPTWAMTTFTPSGTTTPGWPTANFWPTPRPPR